MFYCFLSLFVSVQVSDAYVNVLSIIVFAVMWMATQKSRGTFCPKFGVVTHKTEAGTSYMLSQNKLSTIIALDVTSCRLAYRVDVAHSPNRLYTGSRPAAGDDKRCLPDKIMTPYNMEY